MVTVMEHSKVVHFSKNKFALKEPHIGANTYVKSKVECRYLVVKNDMINGSNTCYGTHSNNSIPVNNEIVDCQIGSSSKSTPINNENVDCHINLNNNTLDENVKPRMNVCEVVKNDTCNTKLNMCGVVRNDIFICSNTRYGTHCNKSTPANNENVYCHSGHCSHTYGENVNQRLYVKEVVKNNMFNCNNTCYDTHPNKITLVNNENANACNGSNSITLESSLPLDKCGSNSSAITNGQHIQKPNVKEFSKPKFRDSLKVVCLKVDHP